jgi:hypothetical protein
MTCKLGFGHCHSQLEPKEEQLSSFSDHAAIVSRRGVTARFAPRGVNRAVGAMDCVPVNHPYSRPREGRFA